MTSSGGTDSATMTFEKLGLMPQQLSSTTTTLMAVALYYAFYFLNIQDGPKERPVIGKSFNHRVTRSQPGINY